MVPTSVGSFESRKVLFLIRLTRSPTHHGLPYLSRWISMTIKHPGSSLRAANRTKNQNWFLSFCWCFLPFFVLQSPARVRCSFMMQRKWSFLMWQSGRAKWLLTVFSERASGERSIDIKTVAIQCYFSAAVIAYSDWTWGRKTLAWGLHVLEVLSESQSHREFFIAPRVCHKKPLNHSIQSNQTSDNR